MNIHHSAASSFETIQHDEASVHHTHSLTVFSLCTNQRRMLGYNVLDLPRCATGVRNITSILHDTIYKIRQGMTFLMITLGRFWPNPTSLLRTSLLVLLHSQFIFPTIWRCWGFCIVCEGVVDVWFFGCWPYVVILSLVWPCPFLAHKKLPS